MTGSRCSRTGIPDAVAERRRRRAARSSASGSTSPRAPCCRSPPTARRCAGSTQFRGRRHAWPKLWKHHAAQPVADRLNEVALERGEPFLERYGGRISSEWYFPKLIELWSEDREVYDAGAAFIEATDWIVWHLTGRECRQSATAGYKAMWSPDEGLPPTAYFEAAYPGLLGPGGEARDRRSSRSGRAAGTLTAERADAWAWPRDVAVAVGNVDSFVSVPGRGRRRARRRS